MSLSHIYFQIFVTFVVKLRINPYLAGSDYRVIVRIFADYDEAKEPHMTGSAHSQETFTPVP
jgi:hypothetical protein